MVDVSYYFICLIIFHKNFTRTHSFISLNSTHIAIFFIFVKKTLMYIRMCIQRSATVRENYYDPYDLIKLVVRGIKNTILNNYLYIYIHYNTYNTLQYSRKITRNYTFGNLTNFQKKKKIPFFPSLPIDRIERLNAKYNWTKRRIHRLTY